MSNPGNEMMGDTKMIRSRSRNLQSPSSVLLNRSVPGMSALASTSTYSGNGTPSPAGSNGNGRQLVSIKRQREFLQSCKNEEANTDTDDQVIQIQDSPEEFQDSIQVPADPNNDPDYIVKFIRRVKSVPMIYNQEDPDFRCIPKKNAAWKQISEEFHQNQVWCMKKWISLRDYYVKRKKLHRLGRPARSWIYYNEMRFLNTIYGRDPSPPVLSPNKPFDDSSSQPEMQSVTYTLDEDLFAFHNEASPNPNSSSIDDHENDDEYENEEDIQILDHHSNQHQQYDAGVESQDYYSHNNTSSPNKKPRIDVFTNSLSIVNSNSKINVKSENSKRSHYPTQQSHKYHHNGAHRHDDRAEDEEQVFEEEDDDEPIQAVARYDNPCRSPDVTNTGNMNNQTRDAYDLFCLSVAAQMRNMPRASALQFQVKIMELMYDTEVGQSPS